MTDASVGALSGPRGLARLRRWYWRHVRRYEGEICHECGRPVRVVWWAADWMWAEVMGYEGGILCPPCFDVRIGHPNVIFIRWVPVVGG